MWLYWVANRLPNLTETLNTMAENTPKWIAVNEIGNDNFATSIYENEYKGLLVARCNQNGQYPEQAALIIRALEFSNIVSLFPAPKAVQ